MEFHYNNYDKLVKVIIVGDDGVGKTSLCIRLKEDRFETSYMSTIGVDFHIKMINDDNKKYKLQIWDTAGQERFRTIVNSYYRNSKIIIIMFDLSKKETFYKIEYWLEEIMRHADYNSKIILVGNKNELTSEINNDEIIEFCSNYNLEYVSISVKENVNIDKFIDTLNKIIPTLNIEDACHHSLIKVKETSKFGCCVIS